LCRVCRRFLERIPTIQGRLPQLPLKAEPCILLILTTFFQGEKGEAEAYCYHFREEGSLKNLRQVFATLCHAKKSIRDRFAWGLGLAGSRSRATTRKGHEQWTMPSKRQRRFTRNRLAKIKICDVFTDCSSEPQTSLRLDKKGKYGARHKFHSLRTDPARAGGPFTADMSDVVLVISKPSQLE
jgi:hypothetical protein